MTDSAPTLPETAPEQAPDLASERDRLVLAALDHVPFDGWSDKALRHAAEDCGLDAMAPARAFPHGVVSAVEHLARLGDRLMLADAQAANVEGLPVHQRVGAVLRRRFERWAPHKEAIRRALAVYALPANVGLAAHGAWRTADAAWKAAGDRSTDFNWYTKRASLAAVYSATLLYWLDDSSEDGAATFDFLDRRLVQVAEAVKGRRKLAERLSRLPNPLATLASLSEGRGKLSTRRGKGGSTRRF